MIERTDAILHINDVPAFGVMTYTPPALFGMMG